MYFLKKTQITSEFGVVYGKKSMMENWKTNENVEQLWINGQIVKFIPKNIPTFYPTLKSLVIRYCQLTSIKKSNFEGFSMLEYLDLGSNKITTIAGDTFKDLLNLKKRVLKN